jgi:hypothetical protein
MEIPSTAYEIQFSNSRNFFRIPEQGSEQYLVAAKVYANGLEFEREIEYQLAEPKSGVSIEPSTGRLIISSTAEEGTIIVKALSEDLETTMEVILYKSGRNTPHIQFPVEEGKSYLISIYGQALETSATSYQMTIETENCQWADLCAFTSPNELSVGEINDTNGSIYEVGAYSIIIIHQLNIPDGYQWSGVVNVVKIKANETGLAAIAITEL